MSVFDFKWLYGIVGGAFFLFISWVVSNYLNWRVNNKVYKELVAIKLLLQQKK